MLARLGTHIPKAKLCMLRTALVLYRNGVNLYKSSDLVMSFVLNPVKSNDMALQLIWI